MQLVSIDKLTVRNFGPYYGEHAFDFTPKGKRSTVLIGGKNGAGKTHLLRALYLATVGESGRVDLKKMESPEEASKFDFEHSLNRRARKEGEDKALLSVTISQANANGSGVRRLTLNREIKYRASGPAFKSSALISDGGEETDDDKRIEKLRDAFLPRHLARFFFFDAERSQSVKLTEREITEGISRILGLWTYNELEDDLRNLVNTKIPRSFGAGADAERRLANLSAEILAIQGNLKAAHSERQDFTSKLDDIRGRLAEIEDELKTIGATDPELLADLQVRKEQHNSRETELRADLKQAWEATLPLALLGAYRLELSNYLVSEEARRDWENRKDSVEPRIPGVLVTVFGEQPENHRLSSETTSFYQDRLTNALRRLFDPPPQGMSDSIFVAERTEISQQVRSKLAATLKQAADLVSTFRELDQQRAEIRDLNQQINQLQQDRSAVERGNELREARAALLAQQDQCERGIEKSDAEIGQLESRLAEVRREESVASQEVAKILKGKSLAALATKYREAVTEIRQRAAVQLREEISDAVGRLWIQICQREREYDRMAFDAHWLCDLVRKDGSQIRWDDANPSAGQRQVRLLAFTEALRRLARQVPPLVVDTPLGRLDKEVRSAVLEKLYLTGHQSIILSTDSEIDPNSDQFERIKGKLVRAYTLDPHNDGASSNYEVKVQPDYFGKRV